ncbi:DUF2905 domain-containing protein [Wenzhouxiangella sp. XN79A]|uniref:DUF2905 family protein n=1 Tax=Wenzhouxiangella sp. XN79A TaxID=2724193 RepID=UPI00144A7FCD|nr:DUF2905 domain-containing protein [Wenzhouxiangella sp. XN79A]
MGKLLIVLGLAIALLGVILYYAPWLLNWFGKLPGDIRIERDGGSFYFPIVSMIIASVVLSVIVNLFLRR